MEKQNTQVTEREQAMYGMSTEDIRMQYMESITAQHLGLEMVVASILSDCQELNAYKHSAPVNAVATTELIRKQLNIAKFILFEILDSKEAVR